MGEDDIARLVIEVDSRQVGAARAALDQFTTGARVADAGAMGFSRTMLKAGAIIAGVTATLAAATKTINSIKDIAKEFEQSLAEVAAVTRASREEMVALEATARRLGATTRFSASQAAEGMRFLGMAGFEVSDIIGAMPGLLSLAAAAGMDLGEAADITSNIMSGFNMAATESGKVADILAGAASSANTNVSQLGEGMKFVAPIAASLGVDIESTAAAMGVLSDAGLQGSMAGTGLRQVLSNLANTTPQARAVLESYGLTVEEVNPATTELVDIIGKLSEVGIDAADAFTIFGDRGAPAILALTSQVTRLRKLDTEFRDLEGRAKEMATVMGDTLMGDVKIFQSAVEELALKMNEKFGITDAFRSATQAASEFVQSLSGATPGNISGILEEMYKIDEFLVDSAGGRNARGRASSKVRRSALEEALEALTGGLSPEEVQKEISAVTRAIAEAEEELANPRADTRVTNSRGKVVRGSSGTDVEALQEELEALKYLRESYQKIFTDVEARASEERAEAAEKSATAQAAAEEQRLARETVAREEANAKAIEEIRTFLMTEEEAIRASYDRQIKLVEDNVTSVETKAELIRELRERMAEDLAELADQDDTELIERRLIRLEEGMEREKLLLLENYNERQELLQTALNANIISEQEFHARSIANWDAYKAAIESITQKLAVQTQTAQLQMYSDVLSYASKISGQLYGLAKENSDTAKALFVLNKAVAIAQAVVYTELAATRAMAEGGYILGIPMAVAIRALGYASVGLMAATAVQEYQGTFDRGGQIPAGATGIVGEYGPELIRGPAQVTSRRATADMLGGGSRGGEIKIIVNNNAGAQIDVQHRKLSDSQIIQISVDQAVQRVAKDADTGAGPVSRTFEKRYGLRRGTA